MSVSTLAGASHATGRAVLAPIALPLCFSFGAAVERTAMVVSPAALGLHHNGRAAHRNDARRAIAFR